MTSLFRSPLALMAASAKRLNEVRNRILTKPIAAIGLPFIAAALLPPIGFLLAAVLLLSVIGLRPTTCSAQQNGSPPPTAAGESVENTASADPLALKVDDPPVEHYDPQMEAIIRAVREQELRLANLETVVRLKTNYEEGKWTIGSRTETNRTIQQDGLLYFEGKEIIRFNPSGGKFQRRVSAFDGNQTVSIEYDNCANIHLRRYEPSEMLPPHSWGLLALEVNFPLSIYLQGGKALDRHPKLRRFQWPSGPGFENRKTKSEYVGTEKIGELECDKIRVRRWSLFTKGPITEYLWLAPARNFHCLKVQRIYPDEDQEYVITEGIVEDFLEIAPDLWLPQSVITRTYDFRSVKNGDPKTAESKTLRLTQAKLTPAYPVSQFKVAIPDGLDVFTIGPDGITDSPHHPQPTTPAKSTTLAGIIAKLQEQEKRYQNFDVVVFKAYQQYEPATTLLEDDGAVAFSGVWVIQKSTQRTRSISQAGRFFSRREFQTTGRKGAYESQHVSAFDGRWTRQAGRSRDGDNSSFRGTSAALIRGNDVIIQRPHTLTATVIDDGRPLSEFLSSDVMRKGQGPPQKVYYEGDDMIDGLLCHRIRGDLIHGDQGKVDNSFRLWLARDRNFLPVRSGWVPPSRRSDKLPTGVCIVTDLQELSPGVWMPMAWRQTAYNGPEERGLSEHRMIENWRSDFHIESATPDPDVDPELFETVIVPAEAKVYIRDAGGIHYGTRIQGEEGNLAISDEEFEQFKKKKELENKKE